MTGPPGLLNAPNVLDDVTGVGGPKKARKIAALMNDPVSRGRMLRIAQDYELIALHAQWRSEKHHGDICSKFCCCQRHKGL